MKNKKGTVIGLGIISIGVLICFTGLVVDASLLYIDRNNLQAIADQAALAGAAKLSESVSSAEAKALEIAQGGGMDVSNVTITTPYNFSTDTSDPRYEASDLTIDSSYLIKVQTQKIHTYTFGRLVGLTRRNMSAYSIGMSPGDPLDISGVTPLGIVEQNFVYGNTYEVKLGGGTANSNRGALRFGGTGSDVWRNNMQNGYTGTVSIGDAVNTEPGRNAGPTNQSVDHLIAEDLTGTFENHSDTSPRVLVVAIIDTDPSAIEGTTVVNIVGFAFFWLVGEGSQSSIEAKYLGEVKVGKWGQATVIGENGTYHARLIR